MTKHKFKAGQKVDLVFGRASGPAPSGKFEIVRTLPETGGTNQYRVRSITNGQERVVAEFEIGAGPGFRPG